MVVEISNIQSNKLPKIVIFLLFICIGACLSYVVSDVFELPAFELILVSILIM